MKNGIFKHLLLLALPASGKSEVRKVLHLMEELPGIIPGTRKDRMHIGEMAQLDDFPYVHMMRRIDAELEETGLRPIFFPHPDLPFFEPRISWLVLIHLLNEDYEMILTGQKYPLDNCAKLLLDRFNAAWGKLKARQIFQKIGSEDPEKFNELCQRLEKDSRDTLEGKNAQVPETPEGKTIIIEFARGGKVGAPYK